MVSFSYRTNSLLDRINEDFFRPRGLYCLIVSCNPITLAQKDKVDDTEMVSRSMHTAPGRGLAAKTEGNLRNHIAAVTEGEENLPTTVAPLIFPQRPAEPPSPGTKGEKRKEMHLPV